MPFGWSLLAPRASARAMRPRPFIISWGFMLYSFGPAHGHLLGQRKVRVQMIEEPVHVTDASFEQTVLKSSLPVVVDFWAAWCTPCRMVAPTLDKLAKENAGKLLVAISISVPDDRAVGGLLTVGSSVDV